MRIEIEIKDDIKPTIALQAVQQVIAHGKVSEGEKGKKYYCWASTFDTPDGAIVVCTRQYRKNDCLCVMKERQ